LQKILSEPPFIVEIVPVHELEQGSDLLQTVWDANELSYEHYTIRLDSSV